MLDWSATRLQCDLDLAAEGRRIGDLRLRHSDNRQPLGYRPVPLGVLVNGTGPTVLLTGGVHGDEFEGPVALMRLLHGLDLSALSGRLIVLPALNAPALMASSRVSPLDGGNLNRAFPGDRDGGPTAMIAHFVEAVLLPHCDAAIDIHSGGLASVFAPAALATKTADAALAARNLELAQAFGAPLIWRLGPLNDDRSLNAAAARKGVPMIAAELGGGGAADPRLVRLAHDGILRCLASLGCLASAPPAEHSPRLVEIRSPRQSLYAPVGGLFEPRFGPGQEVREGEVAGALHAIAEPERPPTAVTFPCSGVVLARGNRCLVERGELLASLVVDVEDR